MVHRDCNRLDVLINNAGIGSGGSTGKRETSQDGYELRFAVNYLAGFLLTRQLLALMMVNKPAAWDGRKPAGRRRPRKSSTSEDAPPYR